MDWTKCITNRLLRVARREAGITLIETVLAIAIFGIVSTSLIGVLTSATAADSRARQKTIALELAQQQMEYVRQLNYSDAGTQDGNPPGNVLPVQKKQVAGLWYTLTTSIRWVSDPIPSSFATSANYKRVRVVVSLTSDGKVLSTVSTYLSNAARDKLGGIDNAIANIIAEDYKTHQRLPGVTIELTNGAFHSGEVTDQTGVATFPGLDPTQGSEHYEAIASLSGYTMFKGDLPALFTLEPSGTGGTTVHLYKPSSIYVNVTDGPDGPPFPGATVTITSSRGSTKSVTTDGSGQARVVAPDTLDDASPEGEAIYPDSGYSITASADAGNGCRRTGELLANQTVPDDYPTNLSSTFEVSLGTDLVDCPVDLTVNVRRVRSWNTCETSTTNLPYYWVSLTPAAAPQIKTPASGQVVFHGIPEGPYNIKAVGASRNGSLNGVVVDATHTVYCVPVNY